MCSHEHSQVPYAQESHSIIYKPRVPETTGYCLKSGQPIWCGQQNMHELSPCREMLQVELCCPTLTPTPNSHGEILRPDTSGCDLLERGLLWRQTCTQGRETRRQLSISHGTQRLPARHQKLGERWGSFLIALGRTFPQQLILARFLIRGTVDINEKVVFA